MPLQGRCRAIANKMPNGTRNVIRHMTTDLGPVRATRKKKSRAHVVYAGKILNRARFYCGSNFTIFLFIVGNPTCFQFQFKVYLMSIIPC